MKRERDPRNEHRKLAHKRRKPLTAKDRMQDRPARTPGRVEGGTSKKRDSAH